MAVKHVKDYYKKIEAMYFDLLGSLKEMEQDFKDGKVTEDELNNLLLPTNSIKENYLRLSYVLFLLFQPQRDSKKAKYESSNKELIQYFKDNNLTKEQELAKDYDALKEFKKLVAERKK